MFLLRIFAPNYSVLSVKFVLSVDVTLRYCFYCKESKLNLCFIAASLLVHYVNIILFVKNVWFSPSVVFSEPGSLTGICNSSFTQQIILFILGDFGSGCPCQPPPPLCLFKDKKNVFGVMGNTESAQVYAKSSQAFLLYQRTLLYSSLF